MSTKQTRRSCLVRYSQADLQLFPTRESFGSAVVEAFNTGSGKVKVDYWSCALEDHKDGGKHFHAALKLRERKGWLSAKNSLNSKYNIVVKFSESYDDYCIHM